MSEFFDELHRLYHDARDTNSVAERWYPEQPHYAKAVRFYVRSARHRRWSFAREMHPRLFATLTEAQSSELHDAYMVTPAGGDPDWFVNTGLLPPVVETLVAKGRLPVPAKELAWHETQLFTAGRADTLPAHYDSRAAFVPNPTMEIVEYEHDWAAVWVRPAAEGVWPKPGTTLVAYFLHPDRKPRWHILDAPALAALRIASAGLGIEQAAEATGMGEVEVHRTLAHWGKVGILSAE